MELKNAEFVEFENIIKRSLEAFVEMSKVNVKRYEQKLKKLENKLVGLKDELATNEKVLDEAKKALDEVKDINLSGIDATALSDLDNSLPKLIQERKAGQERNRKDIDIMSKVERFSKKEKEIDTEIARIMQVIRDTEVEKQDLINEKEQERLAFANSASALTEKLCSYGKVNMQKTKAAFAGKNVTIKPNLEAHQCEKTLSVRELRTLDAIVTIIECKAKFEAKKTEFDAKAASAASKVNYIPGLLSDDRYDMIAYKENKKTLAKEKRKAGAEKTKAMILNSIGRVLLNNSDDSVLINISDEKPKDSVVLLENIDQYATSASLNYDNIKDQISVNDDCIKYTKSDIRTNERNYAKANRDLSLYKQNLETVKNALSSADDALIFAVQSIVDDENIDFATALELIKKELEKTAFDVKFPDVTLVKTK